MPVVVEQMKQWIGENHKTLAFAVGGLIITVKVLIPALQQELDKYRMRQVFKKWESAPSDVVIMHTFSRGKTIPNLSPFAMKLETYLRIANIPYVLDFEDPMGPTGKSPWITFNGEHITDSQLIINFLSRHVKITKNLGRRKFDVKIGSYTDKQRAIAKAVRIMMDEYLYWGICLWRYVHSEGKGLDQIFDMPPFAIKLFYKMVNKRAREYAWGQGIGRHSREQITEMMKGTLKTASLILGDKPFLLGEEPCEEDCSLFGFLGMVLWATPGSPYEAYMNELPNMKDYCNRMQSRYWSDWNKCLAGQQNSKK